MRTLLIAALLLLAAAGARAQLSMVGIGPADNGAAGPPPVSCASTGTFDLSNTCNDVYLLTGSL